MAAHRPVISEAPVTRLYRVIVFNRKHGRTEPGFPRVYSRRNGIAQVRSTYGNPDRFDVTVETAEAAWEPYDG